MCLSVCLCVCVCVPVCLGVFAMEKSGGGGEEIKYLLHLVYSDAFLILFCTFIYFVSTLHSFDHKEKSRLASIIIIAVI